MGSLPYSVSKGALILLTFSLTAELAPYGATVNGIAPFVSSLVFMSFLLEGLTSERSLCYVNRQRGNPPAPLSPAADFT